MQNIKIWDIDVFFFSLLRKEFSNLKNSSNVHPEEYFNTYKSYISSKLWQLQIKNYFLELSIKRTFLKAFLLKLFKKSQGDKKIFMISKTYNWPWFFSSSSFTILFNNSYHYHWYLLFVNCYLQTVNYMLVNSEVSWFHQFFGFLVC